MSKKCKIILCVAAAVVLIVAAGVAAGYFGLIPQKTYGAEDFGIKTVQSSVDFNKNGINDYSDIMAGARKDAQNRPRYDGAYCAGGYPSEDVGVCTDVVWRAFRNAGYSLKDMVDEDIATDPKRYPHIVEADPNIDFRRVTNLRVFFEKYAISLTTDINAISAWQPGDIVVFGENKHVGIVSDRRNKDGQPYILHNGGQYQREENYLPRATVTAHFRFDASQVTAELLKPWTEGAV